MSLPAAANPAAVGTIEKTACSPPFHLFHLCVSCLLGSYLLVLNTNYLYYIK